MACAFDLYRSRSGHLLVVVQDDQFDDLPTRVFAPCQPSSRSAKGGALTPEFSFADRQYNVMIPLLGTSRTTDLGTKIGNLAHLREDIIRAFDLLLTGV